MMLPLNGIKTHPLSHHARGVLVALGKVGQTPAQTINPGVVNRLAREGLIELYLAPTPYRTRKGRINWLRITEVGLRRLAQL